VWLRREASKHTLAISQITPVEVYAALAVKQRTGALPLFGYYRARKDFAEHIKRQQYFIWPVSDLIFQRAATLVGRHPLRAYDAIQLATALDYLRTQQLDLTQFRFLTADGQLERAAQAQGLRTDNPNRHVK
jgi:hypothetical protein